jgi:pimeloyl-ACP methyl ester carboxylesterase/DNA-binding CsgD family transcriptional regulator
VIPATDPGVLMPSRSYDVAVETLKANVVQDIRFARSRDGVGIAYAVHGSGPPLLIDACWLSHLQFDWESPVWRHYLVELGKIATVIRYDERGHGLSDRGVTDHSLEARVGDLEAVVEDAGLDRFALMAMAQGGPVAIEYAARHPERLTRLVFYGSYSGAQAAASPEELELLAAFEALIKVGWARPTSEFRRVFSSMMIPGGTEEQMRWLDDLQARACDTETAVISRSQRQVTDSTWRLPELDLPTLVIHSRGDQMNDFHHARDLAAGIKGARLVGLDSNNHIVLADEPAWPAFLREIAAFIEPDRQGRPGAIADDVAALVTRRELDILRLAAAGYDNDAIAAELFLSVRTVERHLQNAYAKLGLSGRTARTAAVARLLSGA